MSDATKDAPPPARGAAATAQPAPSLNSSAISASVVTDEIATVQTTASTTKKKEEMRNESTGITVGDSSHTLADGKTIHYSAERIIGNGSFGVVFQNLYVHQR
ncbi:Glycogen synthase kinase-3 beta [Globisporangium polare]